MTELTEKTYSIGEVAERFNLTIPTLRYYDKEDLIPNLKRSSSGIRRFTQDNIEAIQIIECLKHAGMPIKDIKAFMQMVKQGDKSLSNRLALFQKQRKNILNQIIQLQKLLKTIDFKCEYYQQAVNDGTEKYVKKQMNLTDFLDKIK